MVDQVKKDLVAWKLGWVISVVDHGNLSDLVAAVYPGRNTTRLMRQNLFWAYIYNLLVLPAAALGLFHPLMSAFTMLFSFASCFLVTFAGYERLQNEHWKWVDCILPIL